MAEENQFNKLRLETWHKAYDCSALRYIFEKRANKLSSTVNLIKALGLLIPSLIGISVLSYSLDWPVLQIIVAISIPCTIIQFLVSFWAIIYKWDEELSYSYEAIQSYNSLYTKYKDLANYPPQSFRGLKEKFDLIYTESSYRQSQDSSHSLKEWEKRMGMRYSLREHQCKCVGCNTVPLSLKSTECDVCGKFSFKYKTFIYKF